MLARPQTRVEVIQWANDATIGTTLTAAMPGQSGHDVDVRPAFGTVRCESGIDLRRYSGAAPTVEVLKNRSAWRTTHDQVA